MPKKKRTPEEEKAFFERFWKIVKENEARNEKLLKEAGLIDK